MATTALGPVIVLLVLLAFATIVPMAWRLLTPIPQADVAAIAAYLAMIDQAPERVQRMVIGGPTRASYRGPSLQVGRPYRVLARERDYSLRRHFLAIDGLDGDGRPHVRERIGGLSSRETRGW